MKLKLLAAAAALASATLPAHALLVTDASLIPMPSSVIDFEAYDGFFPEGPEMLAADLVFTGDADSQLGAFIADLGDNGLWGAGNHFAATGFIGELRFTFADNLVASGAGALVNHFASPAFPFAVVVSAYGINNQIIESHTVTVSTDAASLNEGLFLGIVRPTADIKSISFKGAAVVVDDFTYAAPVPEAGTWAMMALGLAAIGATLRRRTA